MRILGGNDNKAPNHEAFYRAQLEGNPGYSVKSWQPTEDGPYRVRVSTDGKDHRKPEILFDGEVDSAKMKLTESEESCLRDPCEPWWDIPQLFAARIYKAYETTVSYEVRKARGRHKEIMDHIDSLQPGRLP